MKKFTSFLVLLASILILQGCCSLNLPGFDELACSGKGTRVSLDQFIIKLDVRMTDDEITQFINPFLPPDKQITIEECKCGDSKLKRIILGEPFDDKGELLTSLTGIKNSGQMTGDPVFVFKLSKTTYKDLSNLPNNNNAGTDPIVANYISENPDEMIVAVLDSGIDLNYFPGEKFLYKNSDDLNCDKQNNITSGWNFIDEDSRIHDDQKDSHGTFITKKILEGLNNSGVNYKILPLKIAQDRKVSSWALLCAMSYIKSVQAETNGAVKIVNASFGFRYNNLRMPFRLPGGNMSLFKKYIEDLSNSALVVTAAGNKNKNVDNARTSYYPVGFEMNNILGVGGLNSAGNSLHSSSNYGPASVDIAAPYEHKIFNVDVGGTSIGTAQISASLLKFLHENGNSNWTPSKLRTEFLIKADTLDNLRGLILDRRYER